MSRITTVVFDIGKVLADFVWRDFLDSFDFSAETKALLARAVFLHPLWNERDRGSYPEQYYIGQFKKNAPECAKEIDEIFACIQNAVVEYPFAAEWVQNVKRQGYRVLLLSNYAEAGFRYVEQCFAFYKYVDGGVISYQEHLIKPEAQIYETLLRRYELVPEETLFLDDLPANVAAAQEFGIHTILVRSHEQAVRELKDKWGIVSVMETDAAPGQG